MPARADIRRKDTQDRGRGKPAELNALRLDGLTYHIKADKLQGAYSFAPCTPSGTVKPGAKDAERTKKLAERQPREKMLQNYVLLIPKARLEDRLKKRPEFLQKKEDAK